MVVEILKNGLKTSPTANTVSAPEPWNWRHKIANCHLVCFLGSWLGTLIWSLWPPPPTSPQRSSWIPSGRPRLNRTSRRPRRRPSPRTTRTCRRGHVRYRPLKKKSEILKKKHRLFRGNIVCLYLFPSRPHKKMCVGILNYFYSSETIYFMSLVSLFQILPWKTCIILEEEGFILFGYCSGKVLGRKKNNGAGETSLNQMKIYYF